MAFANGKKFAAKFEGESKVFQVFQLHKQHQCSYAGSRRLVSSVQILNREWKNFHCFGSFNKFHLAKSLQPPCGVVEQQNLC